MTASPLVDDGWVGSSGLTSWFLLAASAVLCGGIGTLTLFEPVAGWLMFIVVISVTAASVAAIWIAASHRHAD